MSRQIDIGCGNTITTGYERLDVNERYPNLDYVAELDAVPVEDGVFQRVRAAHVIEHVSLERVRATVLPEWFRITATGGTLWVDTPNIERNLTYYNNGKWMRDFANLTAAEQERCCLNGEPNRSLWLNFKVFSTESKWNVHYWNATPELLTALFTDAGFVDVNVEQRDPSVIVTGKKP